jgi:hypothetical protein
LTSLIRTKPSVAIAGALLLWAVLSGARAHPDYISYFNEIGARQPERYLVESDLEWGQGIKRLNARLRQLGAKQFALKVNTPLFHSGLYPLPPHTVVDEQHPSPGWNVITANDQILIARTDHPQAPTLHGTSYDALVTAFRPPTPAPRPWYEMVQPTERLSGLLLFYVPPDTKIR